MSIVLVRHGETAGNAALVMQRPEVPLNDRGLAQAARLAERMGELGYVHILSSDLLRARMTADALHALSGIVVEESPLLQERNFGDLRGTAYADLPGDPFGPGVAPPNGETWEMFHERVAEAFELILAQRRKLDGTLVVVTHGLVCRALVERHLAPLQVERAAFLVPERFHNTSVTVLAGEHPYGVSTINCVAHLEDGGAQGVAGRLGGAV
jgi:probable phosphoglycerate mutase